MMTAHYTLLAGQAVFLTLTALGGCVHGFVTRDAARWRWLAVFAGLAALTGAATWYLFSRSDVHRGYALALGAAQGVLLIYVARRRKS